MHIGRPLSGGHQVQAHWSVKWPPIDCNRGERIDFLVQLSDLLLKLVGCSKLIRAVFLHLSRVNWYRHGLCCSGDVGSKVFSGKQSIPAACGTDQVINTFNVDSD